jgi:hypothetical protein
MPGWFSWLFAFPRYSRQKRGLLARLHYVKGSLLFWGSVMIPTLVLAANVAALFIDGLPDWSRTLLVTLLLFVSPLVALASSTLFNFSLLASWRHRHQARMRKRLAALLAARYGPLPGGLEALLEDDDLYSLYLQRFLAEHQVPVAVPLYDAQGRYLFTRPEKLQVLARALTRAAGQGRDNELFVILADLLELDGHLEPLLGAIRVVLARHHQVVVICAWPRGVPLPGEPLGDPPSGSPRRRVPVLMRELAWDRLHSAYAELRRVFARLGVPITCAGSDESVPLIVQRLQRLRGVGGRR